MGTAVSLEAAPACPECLEVVVTVLKDLVVVRRVSATSPHKQVTVHLRMSHCCPGWAAGQPRGV